MKGLKALILGWRLHSVRLSEIYPRSIQEWLISALWNSRYQCIRHVEQVYKSDGESRGYSQNVQRKQRAFPSEWKVNICKIWNIWGNHKTFVLDDRNVWTESCFISACSQNLERHNVKNDTYQVDWLWETRNLHTVDFCCAYSMRPFRITLIGIDWSFVLFVFT